jgi:signal transduction histidine kinase
LALVRRLIELMHGQVSVESRVGHGTTFSFTLPLAPTRLPRHTIEVG